MSQQHTYAEIAANWTLWNEFVNTGAAMDRDEFDALTIEQKIRLQVDAFGPEADTETWVAWLDGKREEAVEFQVPVAGTFDVAFAGATALGIDVCEELNVSRA